jgi:hypothetical protein
MLSTAADIVTIILAFITIGGFVITAFKFKSSEEETRRIIKEGLQVSNVISDIASAMAIIKEIKGLLRDSKREIARDKYSELRLLLIGIKKSGVTFLDSEGAIIQAAVTHAKANEDALEKAVYEKNSTEYVKTNSVLSDQVDKLYEVLMDIKNRF